MSSRAPDRPNTREAFLIAARDLIRAQGYAGTTVDDLCKRAGVTKGAFFHHFESKEALGVAAADYWSETTGALFSQAAYHQSADPLQRVLDYIDFRIDLLEGAPAEFTCLVGTMVQEAYGTSDAIRAACAASIAGHAATLEADIEAAMKAHGVKGIGARSLALHTQAVLQGAFILAKATSSADAARESAQHLKNYVHLLFSKPLAPRVKTESIKRRR